jgi:two-component system, response regulator, stage 0 sporulation protein F
LYGITAGKNGSCGRHGSVPLRGLSTSSIYIAMGGIMSKILIVEDEQHQRELYAMELSEEGYEVDQASNGKEAVEKVKNNKFDLVVLDIRMPEMDGIEALGKILSRDKKIPIIIYTAYSNYKSNFMTWTADAYVTKSTSLDELKSKIKEILEVRSRSK